MNKKTSPHFKDVVCLICGLVIPGSTRTCNRQATHSGHCRQKHRRVQNRLNKRKNYQRATELESVESKARRNHAFLKKHGVEVAPGTVIADSETRKAVLSHHKRKEKRQQQAAEKVILKEEKERGRMFVRSCVGTGPGRHRILDYHTYFDRAGVEYECRWYREDNLTWCVFRIRGKRVGQYTYTRDRIILDSGSFGLSSKLFVSLEESGWQDRLPKPFDGHSLRKYLDYIIPWVGEALDEYRAKEFCQYQYYEQPWMRNAEIYDKDVTVRLSNPPRRTYRECDGRGRSGLFWNQRRW